MTSRAIRLSYAICVAFFACLAVALSSLVYSSHVQRQAEHRAEIARIDSDRRWCALLTDLDVAYRSAPGPTTELGRRVAAEIHRLRLAFECPER